jgi:hypothetical protein
LLRYGTWWDEQRDLLEALDFVSISLLWLISFIKFYFTLLEAALLMDLARIDAASGYCSSSLKGSANALVMMGENLEYLEINVFLFG